MNRHPANFIISFFKIGILILTAILIYQQPNQWIKYLIGSVFSFGFVSAVSLQGQYVGMLPSDIAGQSRLLALLNLKKILIFPTLASIFYFTNLFEGLYLAALTFTSFSALWIVVTTKKKNKILKSSDTLFDAKYNMNIYRKFDALNYFIFWASLAVLVYIWKLHGFGIYFWVIIASSFLLQIIISFISAIKTEKK